MCLGNFTFEILYQFRAISTENIIKKPIEISRLTSQIKYLYTVEYKIDKLNALDFEIIRQNNTGFFLFVLINF